MATGDPHWPYGCWCGINHAQQDWQRAFEEGWRRANPDSLDAAYAEAEAVLPRDAVIRMGRTGGGLARGWATAYLHGDVIGCEFADTLPAALRALTAKLRG